MDAGWHTFILHTADYAELCQRIAGRFIYHRPSDPGEAVPDQQAILKVTTDADAVVVDWAFACTGAPWIDAALLVPRLIEAGHSPTAELLVSRLPAWRTSDSTAVTALATLWTMFREYKASYGPEDARAIRRQAARAGRCWVEYRLR